MLFEYDNNKGPGACKAETQVRAPHSERLYRLHSNDVTCPETI